MKLTTTDRPVAFTDTDTEPLVRVEPITLTWLKEFLRFPTSAEDLMLTTALAMARTHFEEQTGRQCIDAVWEYTLEGVPAGPVVQLPRPPLHRVVAVTYDDADGVAQTVDPATYVVEPSFLPSEEAPALIDPYCAPGTLTIVSGASWPTTTRLRIQRVCGYGATPEAMPPSVQMVLGMLGLYYHQRQTGKLGEGTQALINQFKWTALPTLFPTVAAVVDDEATLDAVARRVAIATPTVPRSLR